MGTTASGLVYPDPSSSTALWTHFQTLANGVDGFIRKPLCRLTQVTGQSVASGASVTMTFTSEAIKTHSAMHSNSVNPSRIIPPLPGYYRFRCHLLWAFSDSIDYSSVALNKNGASVANSGNLQFPRKATTAAIQNSVSHFGGNLDEVFSADGISDYFDMIAFQASSGAVSQATNDTSSAVASRFTCEYLRPL